MGREARRVPADWQHPIDEKGNHIALFNGKSYQEQLDIWDEESRKWLEGFRSDFKGGWCQFDGTEVAKNYTEWAGKRPDANDYMPQWTEAEATYFMMYENTSEGTPISPAFATPEELARWLADTGASAFGDQTASYEGWLRVAQGGYAPSAVIVGGILNSGVEGISEIHKQERRIP